MIRALTMGLLLAAAAAPGLAAEPKTKPDARDATEECAGGNADTAAPRRVFEMRTYITNEGKLEALHARFRDHTNRLFRKHGMELVGYWTPQDAGKSNTLIYILAYPSREAAAASWKAFQADPEWHKARDESHKNGVLVKEVKSVFLDPTDYSPIK